MMMWEKEIKERLEKALESKFGLKLNINLGWKCARGGGAVKIEKPCSNCGSNRDIWCVQKHEVYAYYDRYLWGATRWYFHVCLECGHIDVRERFWHYFKVNTQGIAPGTDEWLMALERDHACFGEFATENCPLCLGERG